MLTPIWPELWSWWACKWRKKEVCAKGSERGGNCVWYLLKCVPVIRIQPKGDRECSATWNADPKLDGRCDRLQSFLLVVYDFDYRSGHKKFHSHSQKRLVSEQRLDTAVANTRCPIGVKQQTRLQTTLWDDNTGLSFISVKKANVLYNSFAMHLMTCASFHKELLCHFHKELHCRRMFLSNLIDAYLYLQWHLSVHVSDQYPCIKMESLIKDFKDHWTRGALMIKHYSSWNDLTLKARGECTQCLWHDSLYWHHMAPVGWRDAVVAVRGSRGQGVGLSHYTSEQNMTLDSIWERERERETDRLCCQNVLSFMYKFLVWLDLLWQYNMIFSCQ